MTETRLETWVRRTRDAAIEATCEGATVDQLRAAIEEGIAEGNRLNALRSGHLPDPGPEPRRGPVAEPGSAVEALLRATGIAR